VTTIWVALDLPDRREAEALMERLSPHRHFKVGLELFSAAGPDAVRAWTAAGLHVFLDLKLHDIPRTVERATARVRELGAELLTVHGLGGPAMLRAAVLAANDAVRVAAVTVLTSLDTETLSRLGCPDPAAFSRRLFAMGREAGVAAFVCSAAEVGALRACDAGVRLIVPGIRLPGDEPGDQARISDPREAVERGATDLVVGRSVVAAEEPPARLRAIYDAVREGEHR